MRRPARTNLACWTIAMALLAFATVSTSCGKDSKPGRDPLDASSPSIVETCLANGTCVWKTGVVSVPVDEPARTSAEVADAGVDDEPGFEADAADRPPGCTPGEDQTCDDGAARSPWAGFCQNDGTCVCKPGYAIHFSTGRCMMVLRAPQDAGSERAPACTYPADETCNDATAAPGSLSGVCQPEGTCVCNPGAVINPDTGRCIRD